MTGGGGTEDRRMHNLELTEDQDLIVDTVRKFVADAVAPAALEEDEHRRCLRGQFDGLGELGLFGLLVAESAGGAGPHRPARVGGAGRGVR